ncbi:MAG: HPr family phosphocarrier protein [Phycisphaerae bacterium]|nr:HPr family phosphocarrier protein [Phycisphaerae bacterium]
MQENPQRAERVVVISNVQGLHARPAMRFVDTASRFQSSVRVLKDSLAVDGKSPMEMMLLEAVKGTKLTLVAEGDDCGEAVEALARLVDSRFGEE